MASITPSDIFPGAEVVAANGTVAAQSFCIPLTSLKDVSAVEAHPDTGNGSVVVRGMVEQVYTQIQAMPTADRPTRLAVTRGTQSITPGLVNGIRTPYTITVDSTASTFEVAEEPT